MADFPSMAPLPTTIEEVMASLGGGDAPAAPAPAPQVAPSYPMTEPTPLGPHSAGGGWGDTIQRILPFIFASIAGAKGGRVASGAMLNGIAQTVAREQQHAALLAQAQGRQAEFAQEQRQKAATFIEGVQTKLLDPAYSDPAVHAHLIQIANDVGTNAFHLPPDYFSNTPTAKKVITSADRKDAQDTLKMLEDKYGPDEVAKMTPDFLVGNRTLGAIQALANTDVRDTSGQRVTPSLRPRDFGKLYGGKLDPKTLAALSKAEAESLKAGTGPLSEQQVSDLVTGNLPTEKPVKLSDLDQYRELLKTDPAAAKRFLDQTAGYEKTLAQAKHIAAPGDELTTPTGGGMGLPQMPAGTRDEAMLKTLPTGTAVLVKKLADGQMAFPSGFALKSAYWQKLLELTGRYDPSFDAVNYQARYKTRQAFTSGLEARNVNALNTAIGHLNQLSQAVDALKNKDFQTYNRVANTIATEFGWTGATDFDTIVKPVADELTRAWRGTGGAESDIQARLAVLNSSRPPNILHSAIAETGHLLQSKIDSLQSQYQQGMGINDIQMLRPESAQTLQALEQKAGGTPAGTPAPGGLPSMRPASAHGGPAPAVSMPVPENVTKALQSVGPGRHTLSDGSVWLKDAQGTITRVGGG